MNPFQSITKHWIAKIEKALEAKKDFQAQADLCMKFFDGPYDFLWDSRTYKDGPMKFGGGEREFPIPTFQMNINKVAEGVQLFGPVLYHKNPNRKVNPRLEPLLPADVIGDPMDPAVQMQAQAMAQFVQQGRQIDKSRAILLEAYANWTPEATGLKAQCRMAIDESIITGMGLLHHKVYQPPGAAWKTIGSFYEPVKNLVFDPDMESFEDANWIAIRCVHPVWQVEEEYRVPPGKLKGSMESSGRQVEMEIAGDSNMKRAKGESNDLVVYWKIYSKMGMGNRLKGVDKGPDTQALDVFGRYCYLAVTSELDYPLNIPEEVWQDQEAIFQAVQWETPFWADDGWPVEPLVFHWVPSKAWPMSHFKPAMGELMFLNWAYSFVASKMATASKDIIAYQQAAGEELTRVLKSHQDYELLPISSKLGKISDVVAFIQHPPFQADFWPVVKEVMTLFEQRTGLNELMFGMSATQDRSATISQIKGEQIKIRPDDMANKVEDWMTNVGRREALMARYHLDPQMDVAPVLGKTAAYFWTQYVASADISEIVHSLQYRVEAGSIRKPNRDKEAADATAAMQQLLPIYVQYAQVTGNYNPVNALTRRWADSQQMENVDDLMLPPLPPPPAPMEEGQTEEGPPQGAAA